MARVALHGKAFAADGRDRVQALLEDLSAAQHQVWVSSAFAHTLQSQELMPSDYQVYDGNLSAGSIDFMCSWGGDGTLLEALTHIGPLEIPMLGVNTGRLGFLATLSPEQFGAALQSIDQGKFRLEERSLVQIMSPNQLFEEAYGLNEVGIMKTDTSSMIVIKAYLDGQYLNSYWADGLIVATATGSTGYSLSVGGPLVMPHSDHFIIAPMSPHNLNVRPLVISSASKLRFEISSRSQNFLVSLDSRSKVVDATVQIEVSKAPFVAKLIKIEGDDFLQTLRNKLNWGLDIRN